MKNDLVKLTQNHAPHVLSLYILYNREDKDDKLQSFKYSKIQMNLPHNLSDIHVILSNSAPFNYYLPFNFFH